MAGGNAYTRSALRQQRLNLHHWKYHYNGQVGDPCVYCGVVSDTMDHVPPLHYVSRMAEVGEVVEDLKLWPACRECNSLLNGKVLVSVVQRRRFVKDRMRKRYKVILRMPRWDEDDLEDMSPQMVRDIAAKMRMRELIMARLAWRR